MKEHFKLQIETAIPLTQEVLDQLVGKEDFMGRAYVPGQKILTFIMQSPIEESEYPALVGGTLNLHMMRISEESLDQLAEEYEFVRIAGDAIPVVQLKETE